jgi:hypothetical protein
VAGLRPVHDSGCAHIPGIPLAVFTIQVPGIPALFEIQVPRHPACSRFRLHCDTRRFGRPRGGVSQHSLNVEHGPGMPARAA